MKKVVLITGSSTGFGALMAKTFDQSGYQVIATMREPDGKNATAAARLRALPNTKVLEMDVTSEASIKAAVANVLINYKSIDVLINNAGIYSGGVLEAFSIQQVQKVFDTNVYGVLRVNQEVLPVMRAAGEGLIITISSSVGRLSLPLQAPYNASKFAIEALVEASHRELMPYGVETVLIEPGAFVTEIWAKAGINADRPAIIADYGQPLADLQQHLTAAYGKVLQGKSADPQLVADAALSLVMMDKGKRPLRTSVDPNANGADIAYNEATIKAAAHWLAQYGI